MAEDEKASQPPFPLDWDDLLTDIRDMCATLIIGPDFYTNDNISNKEILYKELTKKEDNGILHFYPSNGIFLFKSEFYKNKAQKAAVNYYNNLQLPQEIVQRITELPFRLILNTNPDSNLAEAFRRSGRECQTDYFTSKPKKKEVTIVEPDVDYPLIYNLFGSTEAYDSLVLDYEDIFDHLRALLNNINVPEDVRSILSDTNSFFFLGFHLEKWDTQLLFRYLNMKIHGWDDRKKNYTTKSLNIDDKSESFFRQQFNIKYYGAPADFLNDIHHRYFEMMAKDEKELASQNSQSVSDVVKNLIAGDQIHKALIYLTVHAEKFSKELANALILIKSQFSRYTYLTTKKLEDSANLEIMRNKIKESIIQLSDSINT